jgi:hypothetical protein
MRRPTGPHSRTFCSSRASSLRSALDEGLLVQAKGISLERHGRVEITGFHYET